MVDAVQPIYFFQKSIRYILTRSLQLIAHSWQLWQCQYRNKYIALQLHAVKLQNHTVKFNLCNRAFLSSHCQNPMIGRADRRTPHFQEQSLSCGVGGSLKTNVGMPRSTKLSNSTRMSLPNLTYFYRAMWSGKSFGMAWLLSIRSSVRLGTST